MFPDDVRRGGHGEEDGARHSHRLLDDRWLSLIQVKQDRREYGRYGTELQAEEYQAPPAHYFGVPAVGVRTPEELQKALRQAFDADGPTVIEAVVDSAHYDDTVFD